MDASFSTIPWNTESLWREANASLSQSVCRYRHRSPESIKLANRMRGHLLSAYPIMDGLCRFTCPECTDICCQHAWVWADFRDLLFYHLAGTPPPGQQLIRRRGDHCRYAGAKGCQLDRLQRPFVCTWYICPAQTHLLRKHPEKQRWLSAMLGQIKDERRRMEDLFIQAVFR